MKKHLFIFSLAMAALAANAQTKQPATITTYKPADLETVLYCVSENGKYAAGDFGGVALLDLETGEKEVHLYESPVGGESAGVTAKGVTNDGTIVGTFGHDISSLGAILKKGSDEWEYLPVPEGCGNTEYCPQGVTPDGKYIAGYASSITEGMYVPVIWTLQDDGSYTAEVIAHPTEDLMGLKPQMAILYGISNDGTRAYGILRDFTGFYSLGVIYKKDANGAWTYQTVGQDWLVKDESKKPGAYPVYEDYVTAEAGTPEWYEQDANYAYAIMDWNAALNEYVYTGTSPSQQILVNQNSISGNGKYMVMSTPNDARRYNTEDGTFIALPGTSGQVTTGITNNGDVLMASPIGSPYRTASYCPNSEAMDGTTGLMTWLNNNYAVQYAEGTDGTQGLGTCCTTPDGQTIVGWNNPQSLGMYYVSTVVQLGVGKPVGIDNVTSSTQEPTIENGVLYIPEGEASVSVYATNGSQMASFTATGSVDLSGYNTGLTIVKVKTGKLTQTFKVTL